MSEGDSRPKNYTVRLKEQPAQNRTLTIEAGPKITVHPTSVQFTRSNWDVPRTVTVRQLDVQDDDAIDEATQITHWLGGQNNPNHTIDVTILDDDEAGVEITRQTLTIAEGESTRYRMRLTAAPRGTATVSITVTGTA